MTLTLQANTVDMKIEVIRKANFKRVFYLSLCFMMLLTAFIAAQNLMGQLYEQMDMASLSQLCFFCMFFGIISSSLVSNHYYKCVSLKVCLILGAVGHVAFLFSGLLVAYCDKIGSKDGICSKPALYTINGISAILLGTGISFIWLAQARYVNLCADEQTRGKFNGIFWAVSQICQILSACLATFVLGKFDKFTFYTILTAFGVLAIIMLCFVQPPVPYHEISAIEEVEFLGKSLRVFRNAIKNPRHFWLFAAIAFSGIATSFYATSLGKLAGATTGATDANISNQMTGYVFIVLAVGEVLSGIFMGALADKMNKVTLLGITIVVNEIALILTFQGHFSNKYFLMILCGFFWGFGDTAINTMLNVVIGSKFNSRAEMFACLKFFQATGGLMTSVSGMALFSVENPIPFMACMGALMIICQIGFYFFYPKQEEKAKTLLGDEFDSTQESTNLQTPYASL